MFFLVDGCKKCLWGTKCSERVVKGILLQCCDVFLFCQPHPQGQEPHSQLCCLLVHFARNASTYTAHRHPDTNEHRHRYTQIYIYRHIITFRKLTACSRSQVKCCFASPSLRPLPPLLSSALLISLTPKDKETHCTMGHHLSPQEQLLETFHCQKISSQFFPSSLSLYLPPLALSLCLSFLSSCHPLLFLPSSTLPLCMAPSELYCRSHSH